MAKQLRIGYIGTGVIAEKQITFLKQANIPGVSVTAAMDVNADRLEGFGSRHGITQLYGDWNQMLAQADIDAVAVCTPNKLHLAPTVDSLRAGKHVLLEKPMAVSAVEGESMIAEAKKADRLLMMAFQWRFSPEAQMLARQAREGTFGDIIYVRAQALRRRGIPSWGVFGQKEPQGGGAMIDIGVHIMEMAHYIMGSPEPRTARGSAYQYVGNKPCDVACRWGAWDHATYTVEDLGVGFFTFANGASMTVEASFAAHIQEDVWTVQILGTKGGGTFSPAKIFFDHGGYMLTAEPGYLDKTDSFLIKMRHFCECVMTGKKCEAPAEAGLAVQRLIDGFYRSAERRAEVLL